MESKMTVVAATGNKNKLREFKQIFGEAGIQAEFIPAGYFNIEMPEETGETFEENSMLKASAIYESLIKNEDKDEEISRITSGNFAVISDDSGLCVDALNGRPGVYSARYSADETGPADDEKNIVKLLKEMENVPEGKRNAHFACVISVIRKDGSRFSQEGRFEGEINHGKAGENGFGYDPVFYCKEFGKTSAEMSPEEKNKVSHRGKALRMAAKKLAETGI